MAPGTPTPQLTWIVVAHDSAGDLVTLLPSLRAAVDGWRERGFSAEVIVVDNASTDGSADLAETEVRDDPAASWLRVRRLAHNSGFGAALNLIAAEARSPWLAFSNADVEVPAGGLALLPTVLAAADPDVALLGPAILAPTGALESSVGRFPTLARLVAGRRRPRADRGRLPAEEQAAGDVEWLTGACLFARREAFAELGGFDERFFLYYEDVDLAARVRAAGHRVVYEPALRLVHTAPHHRRPVGAGVERIIRESRGAYFRKHRPRWEASLVEMLGGWEERRRVRDAPDVAEDAGTANAREADAEHHAS